MYQHVNSYKFNLVLNPNTFFLKFLYFFTFGVILVDNIGIKYDLYIYASTFFSLFYIFVFSIKNVKKSHLINKKNKLFIITILTYSLISFVEGLIINIEKFPFALLNIIPYITFIVLIIELDNKNYSREIFYFTSKIFVIVSILALIMYSLGYSKIEFTLHSLFTFIPTQEFINQFNEGRLTWFMSHKSRYATFCMIGIVFILLNDRYNTVKKVIYTLLLILNIYFSNSMTVLFASVITIVFLMEFRKIKKYIKAIIYLMIIGISCLTIINFVELVFTNRNIFTLGARLYIWEAAINFIYNHPFGVIQITEENYLYTDFYGNWPFTNAHNQFLNEFMKFGWIGGIFYLIFFIMFIGKIWINNKKTIGFLIGLSIICLMDSVASYEMLYIFLYSGAILITLKKIQEKV
ncbi:O-antigen ligase family protein [Anoxybacillus sp. TBDG-1]